MPYDRFADIYDAVCRGIGKDYAGESAAITELVLARRPGASTLLDVACGTGGHLEHLRARFEVAGVDLSTHMASIARTKLPGIDIQEGDMRRFDVGRRFDAVVCLFSAVGYMGSPADLGQAVATMARHLEPGGVLVIDAWLVPDQWEVDHLRAHATDEPGLALAWVDTSHRRDRTSVLDFHYTVATRAGVDRFTERHELTMFTPAEYEAAFVAAGCTVERVPGLPGGRARYVGVRKANGSGAASVP